MTDRKNQEPCGYWFCNRHRAVPIVVDWDGGERISGRKVVMTFKNSHGGVSAIEEVPIRFCPMCGREL